MHGGSRHRKGVITPTSKMNGINHEIRVCLLGNGMKAQGSVKA